MRTIIAIPSYNCERQLPRVLAEIGADLAHRVHEIWVIDNRSTDDTVGVALNVKESGSLPNLRVFRNRGNHNLGGTHKAAFLHAAREDASHVVILHGDNQAASNEVNLLLDHVEFHPETQTVLGSRFNRRSRLEGYERKRIWGNRVLNALYSLATGRRLEDLGSGLNLFALKDLDPSTYLRFANALTFNFELTLDLVRRRVPFAYLPITWREEDQISNARNFRVFGVALLNLVRWRLGRQPQGNAEKLQYEWDEVTP